MPVLSRERKREIDRAARARQKLLADGPPVAPVGDEQIYAATAEYSDLFLIALRKICPLHEDVIVGVTR